MEFQLVPLVSEAFSHSQSFPKVNLTFKGLMYLVMAKSQHFASLVVMLAAPTPRSEAIA